MPVYIAGLMLWGIFFLWRGLVGVRAGKLKANWHPSESITGRSAVVLVSFYLLMGLLCFAAAGWFILSRHS